MTEIVNFTPRRDGECKGICDLLTKATEVAITERMTGMALVMFRQDGSAFVCTKGNGSPHSHA